MATEAELRNAHEAHTRLLQDGDAGRQLAATTYEALRDIARRHDTLRVPQVAEALEQLRKG